ncbi:GNAT family N-acetyltransferase [Fictibacillus nanhaiensis]|uniref:GNAT family N-acetyltransferase n=1 Tax=Fictibacillus nanhaiensis TaxID=742169 RepID=UPI001C96967A|nr:GNAT family N-acetyltransferase [Fictibacillus nanhaiensis]MBY6037593.1 GNAT family N-acetyltransferase [Fictibacillus nanhaiensis]
MLVRVVHEGASIGFLPPLRETDANMYWKNVLSPDAILWVAKMEDKVVGSVQLHLCRKPNGTHRAEIAKLMTHPSYRKKGIARKLMVTAETRAIQEKRSLLVLDTREGDPSNFLYQSIGYVEAGRIPNFAISESGGLEATIIYYKNI